MLLDHAVKSRGFVLRSSPRCYSAEVWAVSFAQCQQREDLSLCNCGLLLFFFAVFFFFVRLHRRLYMFQFRCPSRAFLFQALQCYHHKKKSQKKKQKKNMVSYTEHIQTLWGQPAHTRQDIFRRYCAAAADCGSLCSLGGGRPTAQHSVVIWTIPQPAAVNLIFFSFVLFFFFFPHVTTDSQLLLWVETRSTVSLVGQPAQAGGKAERSQLFMEWVLIWGWIYTSIKYQTTLWCRCDLLTGICRHLLWIILNYG